MSITRLGIGGYHLPVPARTLAQQVEQATAPIDRPPLPAGEQPSRLWLITRGNYDDEYVLGIVEASQSQIRHGIEELNAARLRQNPHDFDPFYAQEVDYLGTVSALRDVLADLSETTVTDIGDDLD